MSRMVFIEGIDQPLMTALFGKLKSWRRQDFVYFEKGPWRRYVSCRQRRDEIATIAARSLVNKARSICIVVSVYQDPAAIDTSRHPAGPDARARIERGQIRLRAALEELPPFHLIELERRAGTTVEDLALEARSALERFADSRAGRTVPESGVPAPGPS